MRVDRDTKTGIALGLIVLALCLQPSEAGPLWPWALLVFGMLALAALLLMDGK